jgi:CP family cyanate transporter-like MFS transporter
LVLLFGGTFVIGIAITVGNVLVPSVIKRDFHDRPGPVMGLYTTAVTAGIAVAAAFTVPIMRLSDWGWRPTLAVWAVAPALVLVVWHLLVPASRRSAGTNVSLRRHSLRLLYRDRVAWTVTLFFGLQALIYNAATAWIPTVLVSHGVPHSEAGFLLAIVSVTGMVTTFTVPVLAMRHVTQRRLVVASIALLAGSIVGLLLSPVVGAPAWMLLFGLGQGACYGLGLSFVLLRTSDSGQAADLSGMTQTVGYPLSAVGPISIGILHEISGGWILPLIVLLTLLLPLLWVGLFAAHGSVIFGGGQDEDPEHVAALPRL